MVRTREYILGFIASTSLAAKPGMAHWANPRPQHMLLTAPWRYLKTILGMWGDVHNKARLAANGDNRFIHIIYKFDFLLGSNSFFKASSILWWESNLKPGRAIPGLGEFQDREVFLDIGEFLCYVIIWWIQFDTVSLSKPYRFPRKGGVLLCLWNLRGSVTAALSVRCALHTDQGRQGAGDRAERGVHDG